MITDIPHQSVFCVTMYYELCERLPDGRVGPVVKQRKRQSWPFTIKGSSFEECQHLTEKFLKTLEARINGKVQPSSNSDGRLDEVDSTVEKTN